MVRPLLHLVREFVLTVESRLSFLDPTEASEFSSPRKLTKTLAATRIENASFQERLDARDLEMHRRERLIGSLETRVSELVGQLDVANKGLAKAEGRAKQEESRLLLLHQEVAMLKRHLVRPYPLVSSSLLTSDDRRHTVRKKRRTKRATLTNRRRRESSNSKRSSTHTRRRSQNSRRA
jgi:hypothetical protein